jgi:hypothetical protein
VHFRNIAAFSVAIMMAQAYELVNAYGCGSCIAFLASYLAQGDGGPAADDEFGDEGFDEGEDAPVPVRKSKSAGGRKEDGRMLREARGALFATAEFTAMLAMLQRVSEDSFLMTALMTALMTSGSVSDAAAREQGLSLMASLSTALMASLSTSVMASLIDSPMLACR